MTRLMNHAVAPIPAGDSVTLLNLLPREDLIAGSERLIRGPYALQPIYTFGEGDVFQLGGKVFGLVGDYRDITSGIFTRIVIPYADSSAAISAYRHLIAGLDSTLTMVSKGAGNPVFEDLQHRYVRFSVHGRVVEALVTLPHRSGQ
jgi:hypothetical protein